MVKSGIHISEFYRLNHNWYPLFGTPGDADYENAISNLRAETTADEHNCCSCIQQQRWLIAHHPRHLPHQHAITSTCSCTERQHVIVWWRSICDSAVIYSHRAEGRDSRKSRQKMAKKHGRLLWKSQKSRQKHGKDMASNHGPKDHYTVCKIQHRALTTIITCNARFSFVKFCHCGALTNSRKR